MLILVLILILIIVGFLESKIELYYSESVLYVQGGGGQEALQTDLVRISPSLLQLSSLLHVTLLAFLILDPHYIQDPGKVQAGLKLIIT